MAVTVANSTPYSNVETATTERLGILRPDGITTKINSDGMLEGVSVPDIAGTNNFGMVMIEPDASKRTINIDRKGVISGADNVGIAVAPTYGTDTEGNEVVIKEGKEGVVKPDGKTTKIDSNGWLTSETYADPATTQKEGLVKPDGKTTSVDKDTGKLSAKINLSTLKVFKGATKNADGEKGIVPQPTIADIDKYLSANGGWAEGKATVNEEYDSLTHKRIYNEATKDVDGIFEGVAQNMVVSTDGKTPTTADAFIIDGETDPCTPLANKLYVDKQSNTPFKWNDKNKRFESIGVISLYTYRKAGDTGLANKINKKILDTTSAVYVQADLIKFKAVGTANADINLYIHCPTEILANSTDGDITYITSLAGVKVVRREEHYPTNETDGTLVIDIPYADFSKYAEKPYEDIGVETEIPYYYTAFPYTQSGYVCRDVGDANRTQAVAKEYEKYGFDITQDNDDPATRVSYPSDCLNANWEPITINLDKDTYYLGEWENTFFMKLIRPVMLNYDGTVAYELDHDDQTKTVDGYLSDINDENFEGNAMVEFPKMYFARWTDSDGKHSHVRISNIQLPDEVDSAGKSVASYHCYAHMIEVGGVAKERNVVYLPMFKTSVFNNKMRSLADVDISSMPVSLVTAETYAPANGNGWQTASWMQVNMVYDLLYLLAKRSDLQNLYGTGHYSGNTVCKTGLLKSKGAFASAGANNQMKVFWIESFWGDRHNMVEGLNPINSQVWVKPYPPYTTGGNTSTYHNTEITPTPQNTWISKTNISEYGTIPIEATGAANTYQCSHSWAGGNAVGVGSGSVDNLIACFNFDTWSGTTTARPGGGETAMLSYIQP